MTDWTEKEQLAAYINTTARRVVEEVLREKTPTKAAATPAVLAAPAVLRPAAIGFPRSIYYSPIMPQVGYGYPQMGYASGYQTSLQQQIQQNAP